jgi:hypothetical protein
VVLVLFNLASFNSYQARQDSTASLKQGGKVALIYASPTFHDEVVSSVACSIKDEGYIVIAYVGSGLHWGSLTLPFSDKRQRASESFYGKCVDKWVSITEPIGEHHLVDDPDLLVFVTYPMLKHNFVHDGEAMQLLRHVRAKSASTNVVLVTHRSNEALHETLPKVEEVVPRDQLTFLFLGEHTQKSTAEIMTRAGHVTANVGPNLPKPPERAYRLAHFYPIMPMEYIGVTRSTAEANFYNAWNNWWYPQLPAFSSDGWRMQAFAIQGNFGGKHAHRKDVKGTVECLQRVESSYQEDKEVAPKALVKKEKAEVAVSNKTPLRVSLELIGHLNGELPLPGLQHGTVRFLSDLAPVDYYKAISRAQFMIAAVGEDYMTSRATSSVPAALITNLPLVTSQKFLNIYPCLRDARVHSLIARETECEAIGAAARLSHEEFLEAKKEVATCTNMMYADGRAVFRHLGQEARDRRKAALKAARNTVPHATIV